MKLPTMIRVFLPPPKRSTPPFPLFSPSTCRAPASRDTLRKLHVPAYCLYYPTVVREPDRDRGAPIGRRESSGDAASNGNRGVGGFRHQVKRLVLLCCGIFFSFMQQL